MEDVSTKRTLFSLAVVFFGYAVLVGLAHYLGELPLTPLAPLEAFKSFGLEWPEALRWSYLGSVFIIVSFLIFNPFRVAKNLYGGAHFATEKEIKGMDLRNETGLILGKSNGKFLRVDKPLSVLIFAPPGTGKTAAIIIPSLLSCESSTVTFDPKGELYEKTGPWRSQFSKVLKFAPGEAESASWNPLAKEELPDNWIEIEVHVSRVAESVLPLPKSGDPHWMSEARHIFLFWALFLIHEEGGTNFREILNRATMGGEPEENINECLFDETLPDRIILEGSAVVSKEGAELSGVFSSFGNAMSIFMDPRVAANTTKADIRLSDLRTERTSIYLVVSNQDSERLKPILSLFFQLTVNYALAKEPEKDKNGQIAQHDKEGNPQFGITLFLDEFVRLGKMDEVKRVPAIGRSYALVCIYVVQTLAQLEDIYGPAGASEFRGTCAYELFFTQKEFKVAEGISKAIGNYTVKTQSKSGRAWEAKSTSESERGLPLVSPTDIMSMPVGELLILVQSNLSTPIKCKGAYWFKNRAMKKCVKFKAEIETIQEPEEIFEKVQETLPLEVIKDPGQGESFESGTNPFEMKKENIEDAFANDDEDGAWSDDDLDESDSMRM